VVASTPNISPSVHQHCNDCSHSWAIARLVKYSKHAYIAAFYNVSSIPVVCMRPLGWGEEVTHGIPRGLSARADGSLVLLVLDLDSFIEH
jgi:hypothetical protein